MDCGRPGAPARRRKHYLSFPAAAAATAAADLAAGPFLRRLEIEGRILAGIDNRTIAARARLPAIVVGAFELLFCDCRQQLQADGWIRNCVIHSEGRPQGVPTIRGALLLMAYLGGEQVTEDVLESLQRTGQYIGKWSEANNVDNGLTDLDRKLLFTLQSLTKPVTQDNVLGLYQGGGHCLWRSVVGSSTT